MEEEREGEWVLPARCSKLQSKNLGDCTDKRIIHAMCHTPISNLPSLSSLNIMTDAGGNIIGANTLATTAMSCGRNLSNCIKKC